MKRILLALLLVTVLILSVSACNTEATYTVTFDADGGSAVASQVVPEGGKAISPTTPTKEGYTFAGWFVGETAYNFDAAVTANAALKAKWTLNTYTVTFDADNGTENTTATVEHGKTVAVPAAPTKAGYTFAGWFVGEAAYDFKAAVTADVTVKAAWTVNQYTITFDTDGGSEIAPIVQDFGTAVTAPAAPEKVGYTFKGWDKEIPATMPVEGVVIKAIWEVNQYTITFDTVDGSEIAAITLDFGAAITAPADPTKTGYTFGGWDNEIPATMPAENMTITAKWTINQYTITFDTVDGSEIAAITLDFGAAITAPADPTKTGYTFGGWDNEIPATMPAENMTITAKWTINTYTVTFDADNGTENATATVEHGKTVAVPAAPTKADYTFGGWYLGEQAYSFDAPVTGSITLKALWTLNEYTVIFDVDGVTDSKLVKHGETVVAPAEAPTKENYTFVGWFNGDTEYDFATPVTGILTLKAVWEINKYTVTIDTANGVEATTQTVNHGDVVVLPEDLTKPGFKLVGWTLNGEAYDISTPVTGEITLVATWELDLPDLTAIAGTWTGEETVGYTDYSYEFKIAADGTITATYNNGYTDVTLTVNYVLFENNVLTINYTTGSVEGANMVFTLSDDKGTLTTQAGVMGTEVALCKTYTVTFDWGEYNKASETESVQHGKTVKEKTSTSYTGYTLVGWFDENGNQFDFSTPITSDMTLTAKWEVKKLTLTFYGQNGTTVVKTMEVTYNTVWKDIADLLPTEIPTTDGYKFNGEWYGSLTTTSPISATAKITSDKQYYPGVIAPMNDIEGTWTGTDSKNNAFTMEVDAATQTVTITVVNGAEITEYKVASVYYKNFSGTFKMAVRYTIGDSTTKTTLTLTAQADGTFKGSSNSLVLKKEGAKTFTVTFDSNGGSAVDAQTIAKDATAQKPEDPTKDGFTFAGWYNGETLYDFATPVTGDITLTAKWEEAAATYTVTFDTGNAATTTTQTVVAGELVVAPTTNISKPSGATLVGWFDENGNQFDFENTPITFDITLTVKWGYTVTFYYKQGDTSTTKEVVVERNTPIPENEIPEPELNEGYVFSGTWHGGSGLAAAPIDINANITKATKLYPGVIEKDTIADLAGTWIGESDGTAYTFTINVAVDENKEVTGVTVEVLMGDTPITPASVQYNTNSTNMRLVIKYYKEGSTSAKQFAIDYNKTAGTVKLYSPEIDLEKVLPSYTVTFDSAGGSAVDAQTVKEGSVATAPLTPEATDLAFAGWYLGEEKYDFATPVTGDITLTAKWATSVNLTFYKQDGTTIAVPVAKNETVEFNITVNYEKIIAELTSADKSTVVRPDTFEEMKTNIANALCTIEGSCFTGAWYTSQTGTTKIDFTEVLTRNKNIAPTLVAPVIKEIEGAWTATEDDGTVTTFTTTITMDDAGNLLNVVCKINENDKTYDSIWVRTYTKEGVACQIHIRYTNGVSEKSFTIKQVFNADKTAYTWQYSSVDLVKDDGGPKKFAVKFDSNGASAVDSQTVVEGEKATAPTAPTKEGFTFAGWYLDDAEYSFDAPVTKAITLVAKWELNINVVDVIGSWGCTIEGESYGYETIEDYLFIFFADGSVSATVTETMFGYESPAETINVTSLAKLVYADGKIVFCEKGSSSDITLEPKSILEDVKGAWAGNEDYDGTMIPYTLTINEDGTGSAVCDMFGYEQVFTLVSVDNKIVLDYMGAMKATLVFDGEKLVGTGIMSGALALTPYVDAAEEITSFEQIAGEWHATESYIDYDYGETYVFNYVFVINADGTGSAQYTSESSYGTYETVMSFDKWVIENNNKLVLDYNIGGVDNYDPLTFSLVEGKLVGVGPMGNELTFEKQEAATGVTVADLAGSWSGTEVTEYGNYTYTVTIASDGTGTMNYVDVEGLYPLESSAISITLDGTTVTVAYQSYGMDYTLTLTYADGTLSGGGVMWGTLTLNRAN